MNVELKCEWRESNWNCQTATAFDQRNSLKEILTNAFKWQEMHLNMICYQNQVVVQTYNLTNFTFPQY